MPPPFSATLIALLTVTLAGSALASMLIYILMAGVALFKPTGLYASA